MAFQKERRALEGEFVVPFVFPKPFFDHRLARDRPIPFTYLVVV
jgi:hypothetical protein